MRRAVAIISIVLVFAFAFIVTAQETNSADDKIANLKQQLMEIEWIKTDARLRLEELDEQLKPENIERAGEVVPVIEDWSLPPMDLWVIYPSGRLTGAKVRAFVKWFETIIGEAAAKV